MSEVAYISRPEECSKLMVKLSRMVRKRRCDYKEHKGAFEIRLNEQLTDEEVAVLKEVKYRRGRGVIYRTFVTNCNVEINCGGKGGRYRLDCQPNADIGEPYTRTRYWIWRRIVV